jgi:hypothetical protein
MERYDYRECMREDVMSYIEEHEVKVTTENRDEMQERLYDDMFVSDSVTGNASGSYTFNTWRAEENICHNMDLLKDACDEFGCEPKFDNAEWCDVTIRCYLLSEVLSEVLDEIEEEVEEEEEYEEDEE